MSSTRMSYDEFRQNIYKWAAAKDLIQPINLDAQFNKLAEEIEELIAAIEWEGPDSTMKEWGDVLVVHTLIGLILCIDPNEAMATVWNKIKNRKGKTVNGQFVKEE